MKVLLVAHYFPPDGGAGSQRPASFAQHLPNLGIDLTVVCRDVPASSRGKSDPLDESLLARTGAARIVRASQGDDGWTAALQRAALEQAARERPDAVVVTMSPFEHAQIAFAVRQEFGVRAVLDLRDPWALDGWFKYSHYFAWRAARDRMRSALEGADGVVMNVPGAADAARALAPRRGALDYGVVTNGWEEGDFPNPLPVAAGPEWRIRFAGTFLCGFWKRRSPLRRLRAKFLKSGERIDERGRSPLFLLAAISRLREAGEAAGRDAVVELAGRREQETDEIVAASGIADRVRHMGFLPHDASAAFVSGADALLLPMHGLPTGARARMVPGKLYEYFATGRPILGLVPPGDARDWIARDPRSQIANPCDTASIADALRRLHAEWRDGRSSDSIRHPMAQAFTRRAQAERFAAYLREVVARPSRG